MVLAISNALDLELQQMDVKTAFLNGEIDNEIYIGTTRWIYRQTQTKHGA